MALASNCTKTPTDHFDLIVVGKPAKSQLVNELDALGGVIGRLADATALQKRVLNASCCSTRQTWPCAKRW